ncbi:MAG: amine dehydrogenase large subunit, partial [Gammaproteobacteria bacterium]
MHRTRLLPPRTVLTLLLLCVWPLARADLPAEPLGKTDSLPVPYPKHWFWAHDLAFDHMMDGKYILLNPDGTNLREQVKGMFNAAFVGQFAESATRREIYVSETYYSRVNRGQRTDVVTVYDKATLSPVAEIVLPGAKRSGNLPNKYML